jgi:hypothetical protein
LATWSLGSEPCRLLDVVRLRGRAAGLSAAGGAAEAAGGRLGAGVIGVCAEVGAVTEISPATATALNRYLMLDPPDRCRGGGSSL